MPPLPRLTPTPAAQRIQTILHECDSWLDRLVTKYGLPRVVLIRMLGSPGAIEDEIGILIAEWATAHARDLFAADEAAPAGQDLWSRAVRGVYVQLSAARDAAEEAEKLRRYQETDAYLARIKAGEDVDL